jgi:hypothetical protein
MEHKTDGLVHPQAHFLNHFHLHHYCRLSHLEKDLEILVLRQQLSILQRNLNHPIRPSRVEKMTLAVLITKIMRTSHQSTHQLRDIIRIFQPETVLRWHRELARWKFTYPNKNKGG